MRQIRDSEYAGSYSGTGRVYLLNAVAVVVTTLLTIVLLVVIGKLLYQALFVKPVVSFS